MTLQPLLELAPLAYVVGGMVITGALRPQSRSQLTATLLWPWTVVAHAWGKLRGQYPTWGPPL